MRTFSIRTHLLLLVLAVSVPLVATVGLVIYSDMQQTIAHTKSSLRALVNTMASNTGRKIDDSHQILERLATRPLIIQADPKYCDTILKELLVLKLGYANIGYTDMHGRGICSALLRPGSKPLNVGKSPWFQRFLKERRFTIGEPFIGPLSGKKVIVLTAPIWNEHREIVGAMHLPLNLQAFNPEIPAHMLPPGSHYGFFSEDGYMIWRDSDQAAMGTQPKADAARQIVKVRNGEFESRAADGVTRYFSVVSMPEIGWIAYAGVPVSIIYAKARQRAITAVVIVMAVIVLLFVLATIIARRIANPVTKLEMAAQAVRDGTIGVRPATEGPSEIAAVAREFNSMIDAQQRSIAELRIAATAFESHESMMITDANNMVLRINQAFTETTGYMAAEIVGQTPRLLKSDRHDADFFRAMWESINRTGGWQGEIWDRRKNGEVYPKWLTISAVKDGIGAVTHYIGTHFDISERKKAEEKINDLAFFDQLTGLPNRTLLMDRLNLAMSASTRSGNMGALLLIDLDNFKTLNDTLGHDMGDLLLKEVAQRLTTCIRAGETVARLGGDEFVIMLADLSTSETDAATRAKTVCEKIRFAMNQVYLLRDLSYHITPSIGATLFKGHLVSIDDLVKQADLAMYASKETGRNAIHFFDPAMQACVVTRAKLETDLRNAIEENQFVLHYQAQVAGAGSITGAEALVRWQHPQRGLVPPAEFIPLAEETRLILPLGLWVLETACVQLTKWANQPGMTDLTLAVNVSVHQFHQAKFVDQVLTVLKNSGANPQRLKLELTESLLVDNVQDTIEKMYALKAKGVKFSLDDFGTGYSSLSYLKRMPLDQLKIDRSFVRDVLSDHNDAVIARTIVALAQNLGLGVIAEGVETEAQHAFLANAGCHSYQGYFFSRPLPVEDFEAFALRL
ncbi:MAG: EAL domain-containing protein [Pseudomonadota bacterium]